VSLVVGQDRFPLSCRGAIQRHMIGTMNSLRTSELSSPPMAAIASDARDCAPGSTIIALRLFIDSWRWQRVPWYLRSGKFLAATETEILVELKSPPQALFEDSSSRGKNSSACSKSSTCSKISQGRRHRTSAFSEMR
jgi:hypothetical protein